MALAIDFLQDVQTELSGFNTGVALGQIVDATINGANTYAALRSRVAANGQTAQNIEASQANQLIVLRAMERANTVGILTDALLAGLTTVAAVRALFTAQNPALAANYTGSNPN